MPSRRRSRIRARDWDGAWGCWRERGLPGRHRVNLHLRSPSKPHGARNGRKPPGSCDASQDDDAECRAVRDASHVGTFLVRLDGFHEPKIFQPAGTYGATFTTLGDQDLQRSTFPDVALRGARIPQVHLRDASRQRVRVRLSGRRPRVGGELARMILSVLGPVARPHVAAPLPRCATVARPRRSP